MQVQTIIINKTTWGRVKNNLYATKSSCWTKLYRRTPSVTHKDNALNLNPDRCITIQDFLDPRSRWRDLRTKQLPETCCDTCHPSEDRKSTRLNSSHVAISYAVFRLNKKKNTKT